MHPLFLEYMQQRWPDTVPALATPPTLSIRLNPAKPHTVQATERVPWHSHGFYLDERPNFTLDPALHQGAYYVQDASSMLVGIIAERLVARLPDRAPLMYLDACAAPGGKTTAAIAALPDSAVVFANEFDYRRANILAENLAKWGSPRTVVTRGDTARYRKLKNTFDIIAVDAPCSGEGMMRKDPQAVEQWSPGLVRECADRQVEILENVWQALKPGGYLIYSTCTFNEQENEQAVERLIQAADHCAHGIDPMELLEGVELPGVTRSGNFLRFLPGRARGEGLCVTVLQRDTDGTVASNPRAAKPQKGSKGARTAVKTALPMLPEGYVPAVDADGRITAMPADMSALVSPLLPKLDVVCAGVEVGTQKGKDLIPAQPLALSTALRPDAYPRHEVTTEQALQYLRRDTLTLPDDCPRGFVLLTCGGRPLGFVKHLGNRTNNLYPAEWRIRQR